MAVKGYIPAIKYGNRVSIDETNHGVATVSTAGTVATNVFSGTGMLGVTTVISDIIITSLDTTAGNITVENPVGTVVATIAKGATAGVVVGAVSLANTTVLGTTALVVKSSSAGNAMVKIFFNNVGVAVN